jgi:hypothetical protein
MIGTADFSPCGRYRYGLTRRWAEGDAVLWIMLNPSTADANVLDPTIRRCVAFSQAWGFGALEVANLFALRSPYPDALYESEQPVGVRNDHAIGAATSRCRLIVAAWGVHGALRGRGRDVGRMLVEYCSAPVCLGTTKDGHPRHPLYLRADTARVSYLAGA